MNGILSVVGVYSLSSFLHFIIPARIVSGYCCDGNNVPLKYRLNGFIVLATMTVVFFILPPTFQIVLFTDFGTALFTANIIGLLVSFYYYFLGGNEKYSRCVTVDQLSHLDSISTSTSTSKSISSPWTTFFLGHQWNPRLCDGYCDVKMLLYLVGAVGLWMNILSGWAVEYQRKQYTSTGMMVYMLCFCWFVGEYMLGEEGE